jgi:arylsulfatase A-like enzyme
LAAKARPFLIVCLFVRLLVRLGCVKAAMTTELDYGVGNISAALERTAMWHDTLLIFTSDNGGCNTQHATYHTQRATYSAQHTDCG